MGIRCDLESPRSCSEWEQTLTRESSPNRLYIYTLRVYAPSMEQLGPRIRRWRARIGAGRAEASIRLGVPKRTLEAWEQGRYEPAGAHRERVLSVLRGKHEAVPDLIDAAMHMSAAVEHLQRVHELSGLIGFRVKPELVRMINMLRKGSEQLAQIAEGSPSAGSIL